MNGKPKKIPISQVGTDEIFVKHAKLLIDKLNHLDITIWEFDLENDKKGGFKEKTELKNIVPNELLSENGKICVDELQRIYHALSHTKPEVVLVFEVTGYSDGDSNKNEVAVRTFPEFVYKKPLNKQEMLLLCKALFVQVCRDLQIVEGY